MNLSEYARKYNICYRTAWRRFHAGKIPNATQDSKTGTITIEDDKTKDELIELQRYRIQDLEQKLNNKQ